MRRVTNLIKTYTFCLLTSKYDSINRGKLWKAMDQLGILAKLIRMKKACTYDSKSKVSF